MKKVLIWLIASIFFSSTLFAYTPNTSDLELLSIIETKVSNFPIDGLIKVSKKLDKILPAFEQSTRVWFMLHEIKTYIENGIITKSVTINNIPHNAYVSVKHSDARFLNNRVQFGVNLVDDKENAINRVLQIRIPDWYCFEHLNRNFPLGFTLFSEDQGDTWEERNSSLVFNDTWYSQRACDVDYVKLLYPKSDAFLETRWIWLGLSNPNGELLDKEICVSMTASADNSDYHEKAYCFQQ